MRILVCLSVVLLWFSCEQRSEAEKVIDRAIEAHGGKQFEEAKISFTFREREYGIFKSPDFFEYTREFTDSAGRVKDVLNNAGFTRTVDRIPVELEDKWIRAYSNSVNSVAYFAFLPYGLNDPAVYKEYLGETEISDQKYHVIKVTFSENGGGEDFEDEFLYWINQDSYLIDYLAYSYLTEGGGVRFRKTSNRHEIEGLVLQDYENYKPVNKETSLEELEELFLQGELELLSEIVLEDLRVEY